MGSASGIIPGAGRQWLCAGRWGLCYNRDLRIWKGRAADQWLSPCYGASEQEAYNTPARAPTTQSSHTPGQRRAVWECPNPKETCRSHPAPLTSVWPVPGNRAGLDHTPSSHVLCPKGHRPKGF